MLKLVVHPAYVTFDGSGEEKTTLVDKVLRVLDPNRRKNYLFKQGEWDGYHSFVRDNGTKFPSGLLPWVTARLNEEGVQHETSFTMEYEDAELDIEAAKIPSAVDPDLLSGVTLRDYQVAAVKKVIAQKRGVVFAAPRSGKTEIQLAVMKHLNLPSLLLVNRTKLARQHADRARARGVDVQLVGGGGKFREITSKHVIATVQTAHKLVKARNKDGESFRSWLSTVRLIQGDEIHALSNSTQWIDTFLATPALFRVGYSGTPFHDRTGWRDRDFWLRGCTGPLLIEIGPEFLYEQGHLVRPDVFVVSGQLGPVNKWFQSAVNWNTVYKTGIVENRKLNSFLADIAAFGSNNGWTPLLLVAQVKHGEELLRQLEDRHGLRTIFAYGGDKCVTVRDGEIVNANVDDEGIVSGIANGTFPVLVGSTVYDQGIDFPFVDMVILGGGWKSAIHAVQRSYRALTRDSDNKKTKAVIVDFRHAYNYVLLNHSKSRESDILEQVLGDPENEKGFMRRVTPTEMLDWLKANRGGRE